MQWFIPVSIFLMFLLLLFRRKFYEISLLKTVLILLYTAAMGVLGTKMLFFVENGGWQGNSFFGAVLFLPLFLAPLALVLRVPYGRLADFVSLPGLSMFAVLKTQCYFRGCCGGILMGYSEQRAVYFPIQLVEVAVTVAMIVVFMVVERKKPIARRLYPWCLLVYGFARFVLNWLRLDDSRRIFFLPKGNFWALLAMAIGGVWLLLFYTREYQKKINEMA